MFWRGTRKRGTVVNLTPQQIAMIDALGTMSDRAVADKFGQSASRINGMRLALGMDAAPRKRPSKYDWANVDWERETTVQVAKRLGCTPNAAFFARRRVGFGHVTFNRTTKARARSESQSVAASDLVDEIAEGAR